MGDFIKIDMTLNITRHNMDELGSIAQVEELIRKIQPSWTDIKIKVGSTII